MTSLKKKEPRRLDDFLELSANELLEAYGSGDAIPGSGSAAAFSALMACELLRTVCKLTLTKPSYRRVHKEFRAVLLEIETIHSPRMKELFREDIRAFGSAYSHRVLRNAAVTQAERNKQNRLALKHLRTATIVPIEICRLSFHVLSLALTVFDKGFKSARGDTGVAISNLLSAASGSLFIVLLNLKSFRQGKWCKEMKGVAHGLAMDFTDRQQEAFARVIRAYDDGALTGSRQLIFDFTNGSPTTR